MFIDLKRFIEKYANISEECFLQLNSLVLEKQVSKDEVFIFNNSKVNTEIFLCSGVVRAFLIDDQGNEKNTGFYTDNEFLSTSSLRSKGGKSIYTYQALTSAKLLLFDSDGFRTILDKYPKLFEVAKKIKETEIARMNNREQCLMQVSALDKYRQFLTFYPTLENDIQHYHIASFLGITPVTLSRIRGSKINN